MTPLFKKLNLKETQSSIIILNAPESFKPEMDAIGNAVTVTETMTNQQPADFIMAFVTQQQEVDKLATIVSTLLQKDGVLWFCYPKGSSKKYKCDFNRDTGWTVLGQNGFEPVRMVAIDADWSALRFRQVEHIKKMSRSRAISDAGKVRIDSSSNT